MNVRRKPLSDEAGRRVHALHAARAGSLEDLCTAAGTTSSSYYRWRQLRALPARGIIAATRPVTLNRPPKFDPPTGDLAAWNQRIVGGWDAAGDVDAGGVRVWLPLGRPPLMGTCHD